MRSEPFVQEAGCTPRGRALRRRTSRTPPADDHGIQHAERVVPVGMGRNDVVVQQPSNEQACQEANRGMLSALITLVPKGRDISDVTRGPLGVDRAHELGDDVFERGTVWIMARSRGTGPCATTRPRWRTTTSAQSRSTRSSR